VEYVVAAVVGFAGLAYAVNAGRHARRPDLTQPERATIRRKRESALLHYKISMGMCLGFALVTLALGHLLPALMLGLASLTCLAVILYLRRLLNE
jgi:hypothetical protein